MGVIRPVLGKAFRGPFDWSLLAIYAISLGPKQSVDNRAGELVDGPGELDGLAEPAEYAVGNDSKGRA